MIGGREKKFNPHVEREKIRKSFVNVHVVFRSSRITVDFLSGYSL